MLYPNGQRVLTSTPRPVAGALVACGALQYGGLNGARFNGVANFAPTASVPEGYAPKGAHVLPRKAGGMVGVGYPAVTGAGSLLQGGPMVGDFASAFEIDAANLGLIVSMAGTASITVTAGAATLSLTIGMDGAGTFGITGAGGLSMIVPFEGTFASVLAGTADLKGRMAMAGEWTPYTELSPENLARTVWEYVSRTLTSGTLEGGGGLSFEQAAQLAEIWRLHGLDPAAPLAVTETSRTAGTVAQTLATSAGTTTVTRTA